MEKIKCVNCRKTFPINLNKHKNRDVCYCPFCRTPHKIRGRFGRFLPNLKWPEQKLKQQADQVWSKEMGKSRRKEKQPAVIMPSAYELLALSLALKAQMQKEKEQTKQSEEPNP